MGGHLPVPRRENPTPGTLASFRDFVTLFIAEGTKRDRNRVEIANSDPAAIAVCVAWMRRLSDRRLLCAVQVHADQDLEALCLSWAARVGVAPGEIRLMRKSNSGGLTGRKWRPQHGVLRAWCNDTLFRARLQAWVDELRSAWLTLGDLGA